MRRERGSRASFLHFQRPCCLKENWEVMYLDLTYGTNIVGFTLCQVTGLFGCNTTYNSAWGLINHEKKEAFDFLCGATKELRTRCGVDEPLVI